MSGTKTFQQLNQPRIVDGQRASALRFAGPMAQSLWNALLLFDLLPAGFGFRVAVFCTRTYSRILRPGSGIVLPATSSLPTPLRRSFDRLEQEVNAWVDQAKLAA